MKRAIIPSLCAALAAGALARAEMGDSSDDRYATTVAVRAARGDALVLRGSKAQVAKLVADEATRHNVPRQHALAIAQIESGYRCDAVGPSTRHGRAHGVMQVLPSTAARLGYPTTDLASCGNGLAAGMAALAECYRLAGGDTVRVASCYVGGPGMVSAPRGGYAKRYVRLYQAALARQGG